MKWSIFLPCLAVGMIVGELVLHRQMLSDFSLPSGELSLRAEEFIASQRSTGKSLWNTISFETPSPDVLGVQTLATTCFSVQFPFPVLELRREEQSPNCTLNVRVVGRPMSISLHTQTWSEKLHEYPGVQVRLRDTHTYIPLDLDLGMESLAFSDAEASVVFVHRGSILQTLAISGGMEADRSSKVLRTLYESITF